LRYCLLAVPAFCTAFYIWEIYGPQKLRKAVQGSLFIIMCLLLPPNTTRDLSWLNLYPESDKHLQYDLSSGTPLFTLAERYKKLLFHSVSTSQLAGYMQMLRDANYEPFAQMIENSARSKISMPIMASPQAQLDVPLVQNVTNAHMVTQEIRYRMPEAEEVFFVWGLNEWHVAPVKLWPAGTVLQYRVLRTPMIRKNDTFSVKLSVPAGTAIDYCFLITKKRDEFDVTWPLCEGNYRATPLRKSVTEVQSKVTLALVTQEIRYIMPEAKEVYLVWGLNGWHVAPDVLRPKGTELRPAGNDPRPAGEGLEGKAMHTPMIQEGDTFIARVLVPVGTPINYGFLITKPRGLFDIASPVWEGEYRTSPSNDSVAETKATLRLIHDLSDVVDNRHYFLAGMGTLLSTYLSIFLFLWLIEG
ncbi:MAG: hypothetical protein MN733_40470, partial [Nitrososphaera sp.]|nr:hypothetical protein [Nitrososphaera sp.]